MFAFYDVDPDYAKYLKQYDPKVPDIKYKTNDKFVCGVVLDVCGVQYYAPISHVTQKNRTSFLIMDGASPISSIRFSFMFPAPVSVLSLKMIGTIAKYDQPYADLLAKELRYCSVHLEEIYAKAEKVYKIGCNKAHALNPLCCDFKLLEEASKKYCL